MAAVRSATLIAVLVALSLAASLAEPAPTAAASCDSPYYCATLTIKLEGDGSGSVQSVDASGAPDHRIDCTQVFGVVTGTSVCSWTYRGLISVKLVVRLRIASAAGSCLFQGVGLGCLSASFLSMPTFDSDLILNDTFVLTTLPVSVTATGEGTGRITSTPGAIVCPGVCTDSFKYGLGLTLSATPDAGATFKAWTGACAGQGRICTLHPTSASSTNAVFGLAPGATPTTGPSSQPSAGPVKTPSASVNPRSTPGTTSAPMPTGSPSASPPAAVAAASPSTTGAIAASTPSASAAGGDVVATPVAASDLTPIVLAILGAGVLIAFAVLVGLTIGRRPRSG